MPVIAPTTPDAPLDYRTTAALSLLLSAWLIAIDPIITRDAIIYLRTAEAYLQDGFFASQQLFGRPMLSLCIATVHQLTGLSLLWSGLLLSSLVYALLCVGFVAVVRELGGGRKTQVIAAVVILCHPLISDYRSSIMRDPAYWAFMIMAFRQLLLYARGSRLRHQLGWFAYLFIAILFRFEGIFFAALAPLALLFTGEPGQRWRSCLRLLLPQMAAILATVAGIVLYQEIVDPGARLFPDIEKYLQRLLDIPQRFEEMAAQSGAAMLAFSAREDANTAVVAGLLAVLMLNICRALSWPWVATLLWARWRGLLSRVRPDDVLLLNAHLLIALLYLAAFTLINQFMLERYAGVFTLFALLYLPFALSALWQAGGRWARVIVGALLLTLAADTLHNSNYRKAFVRDAADWLRANTPAQATLISNERYVAYFSRRQVEWGKGKPVNHEFDVARLLAEPALWQDFDYLAVRVRRGETEQWAEFLQRFPAQVVAEFGGDRAGRIVIVRPGDP